MYGDMKTLRTATIVSGQDTFLGEELERWFALIGDNFDVLDIKYSTAVIDQNDSSYDSVREYALVVYREKSNI